LKKRLTALSICLLVALALLEWRGWISDRVWIVARYVELHHTRLSQSEVIRIAKAEAQKTGTNLSFYEEPVSEHQHRGGEVVWYVTYSNKSHIIDDCFWVEVDDRTGAATLGFCG
jgi:nitrate reductase alpha subunit